MKICPEAACICTAFSDVEAVLRGLPDGGLYGKVDAMLMDLGVSSMQVRV